MAEELRGESPLDFDVELPTDVVAASEFAEDAEAKVVPYDEVPDGWLGLDIGPETRRHSRDAVARAKTVFWNGPMGVFEWPRFAEGTKAVAEAVAKADAHTVVGGADSVRALTEMGLVDDVDWASTGGGASSSSWKGKNCPAWQRSRRNDVLIAGNWKMYKARPRRPSSASSSAGGSPTSGRRRRRHARPPRWL